MSLPNFDKLKGSKCSREGCLAAATYIPVVKIYAPKHQANSDQPAEMAFQIPVCANCAGEVKIEHLLTDVDKFHVENIFAKANKPLPDWTRTEVAWHSLYKVIIPTNN